MPIEAPFATTYQPSETMGLSTLSISAGICHVHLQLLLDQ